MKELKTVCLAPQGLGFGEGVISYNSRAIHDIPEDELEQVEAIIKSPEQILTEVDKQDGEYLDDDGCGDGRGVTNESGEVVYIKQGNNELKRSLNRAKLFGGSVAMTVAAKIAQSGAENPRLYSLAVESMDLLDSQGVDYGAHTDEHAGARKSGCGAIDNAPTILANIVNYEQEIADTIHALDPAVDAELLNEVLENFREYSSADQEGYSGADVMDEIDRREKVIKRLVSGHNEMYIVLNDVENYTVNQFTVRDASHESIQVFAVDLWRAQNINNRLFEDSVEQQKAMLGQLIYTLGTAATLTDGTLPVYRIQNMRQPQNIYS